MAVHQGPFLEFIHERLDVKHLTVKEFRIRTTDFAKQHLAEFGQGMLAGGKDLRVYLQGLGQEGVDRIGRILHITEQGHQPPDGHRGFDVQGIIRNDLDSIGHQQLGDMGTGVVLAHQDGHVTRPGTGGKNLLQR